MKIAITDKATMANELNSMYIRKPMTLQQMRFFTLYLAKINPKNPESKVVRFSVDDFARIMQVEANESNIKENILNLLEHTVWVKSHKYKGGITACHLFRKSELFKDEYGVLQVEFQCSEDIEPYIFELRNNFTSFEVWNTLRLRSVIQSRLYQLLKQFQTIGERIIALDDLKEQLGIDKGSYIDYKTFNRDVLKKCQKALAELTDIKFDYKTIGRPAKSIRFTIYKNSDYDKQMVLDELGIDTTESDQLPGQMEIGDFPEFLPQEQPEMTREQQYICRVNQEAFRNEFDFETAEYLIALGSRVAQSKVSIDNATDLMAAEVEKVSYYREKYLEMNSRQPKHRQKYLEALLKADAADEMGFKPDPVEKGKYIPKPNRFNNFEGRSYNFDELEKMLLSTH